MNTHTDTMSAPDALRLAVLALEMICEATGLDPVETTVTATDDETSEVLSRVSVDLIIRNGREVIAAEKAHTEALRRAGEEG